MSANQPPEALDIVWPRLIAIADEMATTMFRIAFSHDVVEVHDMSTGLYDDRVLHHAVTVNIRGNSYRLKDKLQSGLVRAEEPSDIT